MTFPDHPHSLRKGEAVIDLGDTGPQPMGVPARAEVPGATERDEGALLHGMPGVTGRWQPTRAGVLNSWKWADEEFHFADGWLAFIGRNGSGKSLTASQLVTLLLDGDNSQTALSVSGRAAGTLMSRHTDNSDRDDKTGVWWLEYGRTDQASGQTEHLTTGLWLRSSNQALMRAYFITPGRVGEHLTLQIDRNAMNIESLAEQVAATGGEMFTDSSRLRSKATTHLQAISPEDTYRNAVRLRLFHPLDEVQYDALLSVLRTLRSVRTAEKISARDMLTVLTGALPALDQGRLSEIAAAMQRIASLESQLADTREQSKKLAGTDRMYELYRQAVALTVAAALRSAETEFDKQTREQRAAREELARATAASERIRVDIEEIKLAVAQHEGELSAADTALRDHAGAELPHREQRAQDMDATAKAAEERDEQATADATTARTDAESARQQAVTAQQSLAKIEQELSSSAAGVHGDSVLTNLTAVTDELTRPEQLNPDSPATEVDVDELTATPLAWVEMRQHNVENVTATLTAMNASNQVAIDAAEQHRAAEEEVDQRSAALNDQAAARERIERKLEADISSWQKIATYFPAVPDALVEADPVDGRANPALLTNWLDQQASTIRQQLDVPGHAARKSAADEAAEQASEVAAKQRKAADDAASAVVQARQRQDEQAQQDALAAEHDAATRRAAAAEHSEQVGAARRYRHAHLLDQLDATGAALSSVTEWSDQVRAWKESLTYLDGARLALPEPVTGQIRQSLNELTTALEQVREDTSGDRPVTLTHPAVMHAERSLQTLIGYDDAPLRTALAETSQRAFSRLDRRIVAAEQTLNELQGLMEGVAADLELAQQAPAPPPAPAWRTRTDGSPLWALVDFRQGVPGDARDRVEGALLVSGLLDAVVTSDGRARAGDTVLTAENPVDGRSLEDLLTIEPDSPIDPALVSRLLRSIAVDDTAGMTVRSGVLTAAAPDGYVSRFIGTSARERARLERIAELEAQLGELDAQHDAAEAQLEARRTDLIAAVAEQQAMPASTPWQHARAAAQTSQLAAHAADREAADRQAMADAELQAVETRLAAAEQVRQRALALLRSEVTTAMALAGQAEAAASSAQQAAEEQADLAERSGRQLQGSLTAQASADRQQQSFPSLTALVDALSAEDEATRELMTARNLAQGALARVQKAQIRTKQAFAALNKAIDLGGGRMLPAEPEALSLFSRKLTHLQNQIGSWQRAAERTVQLRTQARTALTSAAKLDERARTMALEAHIAREFAVTEFAAVARLGELYGAEYEQLRLARQQSAEELAGARTQFEVLRAEAQQAAVDAAAASSTLQGIAPQRELAEQHRQRCLQQMNRLVDESIVAVDGGISVDEAGRPANLTAALAWGGRMLAAEPRSTNRDDLARLLESRRTRLETEAKAVSSTLTRFDRQVTLQTIAGTDWRRAVVAAPDALSGEDLHLTVVTLQQTAKQLESDLRDDVKVTLKTSMFTALRRDIATRRATAQDLVRQIRSTLNDVRTGVARVGVEVDWKVKSDPDAQRMIELVSALPSDDTFEQMYDVLRQRLEDATGDTWEDRVAQTFDYRVWHEWDIKVTHASFGDGTSEVFRPLTARSNPLASFSTGEMRLATMLPLLAAAWSMYAAPGYEGPRLLFVDEVNAAFDPQNVRKLLALLRAWRFDVLATAPEMSAMLKAESERVMISQVTHSGAVRVSIPWLWTGSGQPILVAERMGSARAMAGRE